MYVGLGFELKALYLQSRCSLLEAHLQSILLKLVILEMGGSLKLFAQAGLKLCSS
jgi:hypothetical protein